MAGHLSVVSAGRSAARSRRRFLRAGQDGLAEMMFVAGLTAACFATSLVAIMLGAPPREVLLGMMAPLVVTAATWFIAKRVCHRKPEDLTAVMIAALGAKLVFFGAYAVVMLKVLALDPIPFIVS